MSLKQECFVFGILFRHYPKQQHTVVSDNPELLRIKQNTEIQSQAKYHADYERSKGSFTVVADDPEMKRVLENTKNISNVSSMTLTLNNLPKIGGVFSKNKISTHLKYR